MVDERKIIRDPIHGDIKIEGSFLDLIETPEIQRLYNIKQLGFAHLVFPGAHHTRLEHSLGTYHIAFQATELLNIKKDEMELITCAALLHDIGHGPFSHTLESLLRESLDVDHIDLTEKLIFGEYDIFNTGEKKLITSTSVCEVLNDYGINQKKVVDIIRGRTDEEPYLSQVLNSAIDVDQLDYLIRDSYYTGVAYGMIDIERFLQTLTIKDGNLAVRRKGVGVIENIFMARGLMYSSVYFHKTVRIAELMLSKAIEMTSVEPFDFFKMTDAELINDLNNRGSFQHEIVTCLKYRKLFKQAYSASFHDLDEDRVKTVKDLETVEAKREKERAIAESLGIREGHVVIDVPFRELHQAEPRMDKTDIMIVDRDEVKTLDEFTPIISAIKSRAIPDWAIMIITDEKYRDVVSEKAEKLLFS